MKKSFLLCLLMAILAPWATVQAQALFSENFEGGSMPDGWTTSGSGTWTIGTGVNNSYPSTAGEGTYNAAIKHNTTNSKTKLITPEIDLSGVTTAELSFMHVQIDWSGDIDELRVYYRSSSSDEWALLSGQEYTSTVSSWTTEEGIALPKLSATYQIAFEMTDKYGRGIGIDDVKIIKGASCPKPSGLAVVLTPGDGTVATLSWTAGGSESAWTICLNGDEGNLINASTNPFQLTSLTPEAAYTAKVKAVCDGSDESAWSGEIGFTPTNAYTLLVNDGSVNNPYVPVYGNYVDEITKSKFIIPAADLASIKWATIDKLTFFSNTASAAWTNAEFEVYVKEISETTISSWDADYSSLNKVMNAAHLAIVDNTMEVVFDNPYQYMGGNLMIGFLQTVEGSYTGCTWLGKTVAGASFGGYVGSYSSVTQQNFLPKMEISYIPGMAPSCIQPEGLSIVPGATSAELSWTVGDASAWQLCVNGDEEHLIDITSMPYVLSELTANTAYSIKLRTNCGSGDENKSTWVSTSFRTECAKITEFPWNYGFEDVSAGSGVLPFCWSRINPSSPTNPYVYGNTAWDTYSHSGDNCLYFYAYGSSSSNQYAVLPEMDNVGGKQISFWARTTSAGNELKIGVMSDPADAETFSLIATKSLTTSYAEYLVELTGATGNYIALLMESPSGYSSKYIYLDDITVEAIPSCKKPTALDYSNVQNHSVQLSWTAPEGQEAWQICLNGDESNLIDADANPFVIVNLDAETAYSAKVRANCGGSDVSPWSNEVNFTTLIACPAPIIGSSDVSNITAHSADIVWERDAEGYIVSHRTAAYVEGFEEHFDASGLPAGWALYTGLVDEVVAGSAELTSTSSGWGTVSYALGTYNMKVNVYGTSCKYWLVSPEIALKSGYSFSFNTAFTAYNSANAATGTREDDRFVVLIQSKGNWIKLREWNNSGSEYVLNDIPAAGVTISDIDLNSYIGQNVKIAFYAESTVSSNGDNDLHIDDVQVGIAHAEGSWFDDRATEKSFHFAGLEANTKYDVTVKCDCGSLDGVSEASSIVSFSTISGNQTPTGLAYNESSLKSDAVSVSWSGVPSNELHESYDLFISTSDELPLDPSGKDLKAGLTETSYDFSGLDAETTYYVWVRDNCGADGYSEWSASISFTTLSDCSVPGSLSISNEAAHTADLAWAVGNSASYNVRYRTSAGFDPVLVEEFGTSLPTGWSMYTGQFDEATGTATLTSATYGWSFGTSNGVFDNHARVNIYSNNQRWLVTPLLELNAEELQFDLALTAYSGNVSAPQTSGTDDKFIVLISDDDKATWKPLRKWDNEGSAYVYNNIANTAEGEHVVLDISAYNGKNVYIAFYGESTLSNADNYIHLDNVSIGQIIPAGEWKNGGNSTDKALTLSGLEPETTYDVQVQGVCGEIVTDWSESSNFTTVEACFVPTNLTKSNITAHTVDLAWESDATAWQICLNDDEENLINVSEKPYTLNNLAAETTYSIKIRTNCGAEGFSLWSAKISATTLAACFAPTAPSVEEASITTTSATISWTDEHDQAGYIVAYGLAADFDIENPATYTIINVTDKSASLEGLEPSSEYKFRVKGDCGLEGESKDWSYSKTFSTVCGVFELPFHEYFEGGVSCWQLVDCAGGTGVKPEAKYEGSNGFKFQYNTNPPQYLISPELVASDKKLEVSFYNKKGGSFTETFQVGYSTTTKATDAFIWLDEQIAPAEFEQYSASLPVAGVKYVAIKYTANDQLALYIDNFIVKEIDGGTGIDAVNGEKNAVKFIKNDHLYIRLNGVVYDVTGRVIEK